MHAPKTLPLEAAPFLDIANPDTSIRSPEVRAARDASWYARTPYGLAILRYAEMNALLTHPSLRQGSHAWPELSGVTTGLFAQWWSSTILVTEGADHTRLRRFVNPFFTPLAVKSMLPFFETLTEELLARVIDDGQCDFMADFADPYAGRVLTMLLGLSDEMAGEILRLAGEMGLALGVTYRQELAVVEAATKAMHRIVEKVIAERRAKPGDDLMSKLIHKEVDGARLSQDELMNLGVMLIFAGVDTTRNQLGLGMTLFLQHPGQWEHLAADPSLDMNAAQEALRLRPTITWVSREATEDFVFQGLAIARGTTLHLFSESAGTDARMFEDAPFDITKPRPRNFGFGGGRHVCLGQIVAKNDMAVAYRILAAKITKIRAGGTPRFLPDSGNTGPITLPIAFDKR